MPTEFTCPFCGETFAFYDEFIKGFDDIEGKTCTCTGCGIVLLAEKGKFHNAYEQFFGTTYNCGMVVL